MCPLGFKAVTACHIELQQGLRQTRKGRWWSLASGQIATTELNQLFVEAARPLLSPASRVPRALRSRRAICSKKYCTKCSVDQAAHALSSETCLDEFRSILLPPNLSTGSI